MIRYSGPSKNPVPCPFRKPPNNAPNYGYTTLARGLHGTQTSCNPGPLRRPDGPPYCLQVCSPILRSRSSAEWRHASTTNRRRNSSGQYSNRRESHSSRGWASSPSRVWPRSGYAGGRAGGWSLGFLSCRTRRLTDAAVVKPLQLGFNLAVALGDLALINPVKLQRLG